MLLASPSAHAPRSKNRLLGETERLGELKPALGLGFDIHRVPAVENAGDVHAFGAGHIVPQPVQSTRLFARIWALTCSISLKSF